MFVLIKISVIVPVYNTQNYLKECIDSVLNQSFKDFELICINDGSTDNSLNILKDYEIKDARVKVISQENRGLGASRNLGLKLAQGEYVLFLDSDDYLSLDALEKLHHHAYVNDLDLVLFKIMNFNYKTRKESHTEYFDMKFLKEIVGDEIFNWTRVKNRIFDISVTATSKLFKRDLISDVEFPEGLLFEDNLFFTKVIFNAKSIYFYDEYFYYRRIRPDSITNSYHSKFSDCIIIYDRIIEYVKSINKYYEFSNQIFDKKCFDFFHRFKLVHEEYKEDFFEKIKANFLKSKEELEKDGTLKICSERSLVIFNNAINLDSYREFELTVNEFDLKLSNDKLKLDNNLMKRHYAKKVSDLTKKNEDYKIEIEELMNSPGWRLTEIFRSILDYIKAKLN